MASSSKNQPLNENKDHCGSFPKTPPWSRKQILESLRGKAPSEELRERRRRCFIASSFTKNNNNNNDDDERLVLDDSKSRRFTLAMTEEEEVEFFQSLWKSLPAQLTCGDHDDAATTMARPTSTAAPPVATDSRDVGESNRASAGTPGSDSDETRAVDVTINPVANLRGRQGLTLHEGRTLNGRQGISTPIQECVVANTTDANIGKLQGRHCDATVKECNGQKNKDCVQRDGITGEVASETGVFPEIDEQNVAKAGPESCVSRRNGFKLNDTIYESLESRDISSTTNANVGVSIVPNNCPLEAKIIDNDECPQGCVFLQICPRQDSCFSETDQYLEEKRFTKQTISHVDHVKQKNAFTQTSLKPHFLRNDREQSCRRTEGIKGKSQRNWNRYRENFSDDRVGDRGLRPRRRSRSCHSEQLSRVHQLRVHHAGQRYRTEHRKNTGRTLNTCCDRRSSNLCDSRKGSWQRPTPHMEDEIANKVDCKCTCSCSSDSSASVNASCRECSVSSHHETSHHETSSRMSYERRAKNVSFNSRTTTTRKNNLNPRSWSFAAGRQSGRQSSSQERRPCRCSDDVATSRRNMAADVVVVVVAPRRRPVLTCSTCDVVVNSKRKMRAHLNGARHAQASQAADERCRHLGEPRGCIQHDDHNNNNNCISCQRRCNVVKCRKSYVEPLPVSVVQ